MTLAWHQWQSESDQSFFSRGQVEEKTALQILSGAATEVSSGLPLQIPFHLQQARDLYRRALLRHPLCAHCQYRLARVAALLELLGVGEPDTIFLFRSAGEEEQSDEQLL